MKNKTKIVRYAVALTVFPLLASCSHVTVQQIDADRPAHLKANFTPINLPADVYSKIKAANSQSDFKNIKVTYKREVENNNPKSEIVTLAVTYTNMGNGLVQEISEASGNGIPVETDFSLNYLGLWLLREERMRYQPRGLVGNIIETKEIKQLDGNIAHPQENHTYVIEDTTGLSAQLLNFDVYKASCTTGTFYKAAAVNPKIHGKAIDLHCESYLNGILAIKNDYIFLEQYGLALLNKAAGTAFKIKFTIEDIQGL